MKIDGNNQALRAVRLEQSIQENQAAQAKVSNSSQGVSFEKNRNDLFIEQLERAKKGEQGQTQETDAPRDAKSKLEILSNLATERDMAQFKDYSEEMEEEELEVIVTVVEKIKTQLATYCDDFDSGMVEELSSEELSKLSHITGNTMDVARKLKENNLPVTEENVTETISALEMEEQTGMLTDDAKEYCIKADVELTIENLYMAMHSGNYQGAAGYYADGSGYYAKAAEMSSIAELMPQIEKIIVQSGLQADDKTVEQAKWLIERQLPLTKENLLKLQQLDNISQEEADQEMILEHIVDALLEGKRPAQALLGETNSVVARSEQAVAVVQNATDEQLKAVVGSGQTVTIAGLAAAQEGSVTNLTESALLEEDVTLITARRQLEEVRLQMTIESTAIMIRNGISVETASLSQLIEQLKRIEEQYYAQLLTGNKIEASAENISLYKEITAVTANISQSPAAVIGTIAFSRTELTIEAVSAEGTVLADKYKQANEAYETVMTKPRSDLGDSIQKAFRNVDDILEDMGIEINNENQRAVRILGYNSIEITEENIMRVKSADLEVTTMLANMKPKAVLEMIREGYNPLDKTAQQINEKLEQYQENSQSSQDNFSEFLWNMEHSDGISQEERDAYIGIYRMLHQIEKSDGAVVGAMLEQGASLTMRNLMTGIRSTKHKSMDYKIGEIDGIEGTKSESITQQIEEGYLGLLAGRMQSQMAHMDWNAVEGQETLMDMSIEAFADYVQSMEKEEQAGNSYAKEQLQMLNQACQSEEQVLSRLINMDQSVTIRNIFAATQLYGNRGSLFKELKNYVEQSADHELQQNLLDDMANVEECFTDEVSAKASYEKMLKTAQNVVEAGTDAEEITFEQMRNWKLLSSQISLADNLSAKEEYHIPVEIAGELTSIHVQFVHNDNVQSKVAVSFETGNLGKVAAEFTEKAGRLEGYIVSASVQSKELLVGMDNELRQQIEAASGIQVGKIDYAQHEKLDLLKFATDISESGTSGSVTNASLYQVAKTVMEFVKTIDVK